MLKNIIFFLKTVIVFFLFITNLYADQVSIIPLKKPILDEVTKNQKLTQGILKPIPKPQKKVKKEELTKKTIKPELKPAQDTKEKKLSTKVVEKKNIKTKFLIPKNKPLVVKTKLTTKKITSHPIIAIIGSIKFDSYSFNAIGYTNNKWFANSSQ